MIGLLEVPLQFWIFNGPRVPDARVSVSPGLIEEHSNVAVSLEIMWSAADVRLNVPPATETPLVFSAPDKAKALRPLDKVLLAPEHKLMTVTLADPDFDESCRDVALIVTVSGVGTVRGAV
jgi:hypothetical protein